jgi:hypothetical protein
VLISPSGLTFFGLTQSYRKQFYKQIHEIVFHGKGGYDWHTVYNMPIWLRNYTFEEIKKFYDEQAKANNNQKKKLDDQPTGPAIRQPDYTTKARK